MTTDPIEAAVEATQSRAEAYDLHRIEHQRFVRDAVAAARPLIEAQVRAEVAAAIRGDCLRLRHHDTNFRIPHFDHTDRLRSERVCRYCESAARIAEGTDR